MVCVAREETQLFTLGRRTVEKVVLLQESMKGSKHSQSFVDPQKKHGCIAQIVERDTKINE